MARLLKLVKPNFKANLTYSSQVTRDDEKAVQLVVAEARRGYALASIAGIDRIKGAIATHFDKMAFKTDKIATDKIVRFARNRDER